MRKIIVSIFLILTFLCSCKTITIKDYDETTRRSTDEALAYYKSGLDYYHLGQFQRAIEDYNEAIRLKPDLVMAYNNRGNAYNKLGKH